MKNLKLFKNENLKKLKIAGSIVGSIVLISLSGCKVVKVEDNNSSHNIQTNEIIGSIISESTPNIVNSDVPETISTTTAYIEVKPETTTISQTTTTPVPETTIITTPITTTTMTTPEPIISTTISTTTSQITTTKPIETKPITTTQTTTVTTTPVVQTTPVETPPIEYNTRTEEIKAYYYIENAIETKLTKSNINNFKSFISVAENFFSDSITGYNEDGNVCFYRYVVFYDLDSNEYNRCIVDSLIEKTIFTALLNEEYINDDTFKKILSIYTYDELKGLNRNIISIFSNDMENQRYYDYSKIVINKNLKTLLTNVQNAYKEKDYVTLEKLCNENFGKYNTMVDSILLSYEKLSNEIDNYPTEETAFELAQKAIDDMGIYDRLHPKTLVLQ